MDGTAAVCEPDARLHGAGGSDLGWLLVAVVAALGILWILHQNRAAVRRREALALAQLMRETREEKPAAPASLARPVPQTHATREVSYTQPSLPVGVESGIVEALRRGEDPDEGWIDQASDRWVCLFSAVSGETYRNPDGVSRQQILGEAPVGHQCVLVHEATNRHDDEAVAVYLLKAGGDTAQIGYLPRGHGRLGDIAAGSIIAWLARVGSPRQGAPLGAALYLAIRG